jgi:uncharacterized repeat protein (TIGR03803 family)
MTRKSLPRAFVRTLPLLVLLWPHLCSAASTFKVLHSFGQGNDGAGVWSSVILDGKGNVYGTTSGGGTHKGGTAFKLKALKGGNYKETILYNFYSTPHDGAGPFGGVTFGPAEVLYGTTQIGGKYENGTVYSLTPSAHRWKETILYSFPPPSKHGCCPWAGVVRDSSGNLYGTAYIAYELTHGSKSWKQIVLHDFTGENGDGAEPTAGMVLDSSGNLYGATTYGGQNCGSSGCGVVYELSPGRGGKWKETIPHEFQSNGMDGEWPSLGALVMDTSGTLYGATSNGGCCGGTVYKVEPTSGGWQEAVLYEFTGGTNGIEPGGGVVIDKSGNLYGTTIAGGSQCDCGVVYELSPNSDGTWNYTILHTFNDLDGAEPDANLTLDDKGNIYGTAAGGGVFGGGVVFEIIP